MARADVVADPVFSATSYRLELGTNSGTYTIAMTNSVPSFVFGSIPSGKWYAVMTAHNGANACHWRETVDKWDDPVEFTVTVTNQMLMVMLLRSTNASSPRSTWTVVVTNLVPKIAAQEFYAVKVVDPNAVVPARVIVMPPSPPKP